MAKKKTNVLDVIKDLLVEEHDLAIFHVGVKELEKRGVNIFILEDDTSISIKEYKEEVKKSLKKVKTEIKDILKES